MDDSNNDLVNKNERTGVIKSPTFFKRIGETPSGPADEDLSVDMINFI